MSLTDQFQPMRAFPGRCTVGKFPDDCPERSVVQHGDQRICFRHAFAAALASEPEAQAMAMVWATSEIERLQEAQR